MARTINERDRAARRDAILDATYRLIVAKGYQQMTIQDLLAMYETMSNDNNAGFRPSGSAGVSPNFTGNDVNGRRIQGIQAGIVHRF